MSVFSTTQIRQMQASGAAGVIIMADKNQPIRDLNCEGEECSVNLHIPVSMVTYHDGLLVLVYIYNQLFNVKNNVKCEKNTILF